MVRGTIRWQVPLGTFTLAGPNGPAGTVSLGGPIVTAGGLVFIAATFLDSHFWAFDVETGRELWSAQLPAPGIAAGGHARLAEEPQSDAEIVAHPAASGPVDCLQINVEKRTPGAKNRSQCAHRGTYSF
jgi:quinoprotein glucose dehydrogenase